MKSMLGNLQDWAKSASYSDTTVSVWLAGLVMVLLLAFLWSTVVAKIVGPGARMVKETAEGLAE